MTILRSRRQPDFREHDLNRGTSEENFSSRMQFHASAQRRASDEASAGYGGAVFGKGGEGEKFSVKNEQQA